MNPDLAALIDLQKTMEHYDALEGRARDLPKQIDACKESHEEVLAKHKEVVTRYKQLRVDLHDAEVDLNSGEEMLAKKELKLHGVKTNEEYKAGLHEIEIQKRKNSDAETCILELLDAVERAKEEVAQSEKRVAQDKEEFADQLKALEDELTAVQEEVGRYQTLIEEKRAGMKGSLLVRFDRIYSHNTGMALAPSNSGSCGYCQVSLPPHRIQAAQEGRELIVCDHCGSILYWEAEAEQVPAG